MGRVGEINPTFPLSVAYHVTQTTQSRQTSSAEGALSTGAVELTVLHLWRGVKPPPTRPPAGDQ